MGFGGVPSVGVSERCRHENVSSKLIFGNEAADFSFEKGAPFGTKAILVCFVRFTQTKLASVILRKPKPGGNVVVNALKSSMVKLIHRAKLGREVGIDLNQPTGIEVTSRGRVYRRRSISPYSPNCTSISALFVSPENDLRLIIS